MRGNGVIVLRQENHTFHEHATISAAKAEAARLAETVGGTLVVYVPVAVVKPMPKVLERQLVANGIEDELQRQIDFRRQREEDDDLPF